MTTNPFREKSGCLLPLVALLVAIFVFGPLQAWAAMLNWNWFATTLGAPRIGFLQAYGVSLVVSSLRSVDTTEETRDLSDLLLAGIRVTAARFVAFVGLGWAVHAWMVN
jgi:hypothetical protein